MKLYIDNIKSMPSNPIIKKSDYYITYNGIYEIKNNKIIQYTLVETQDDAVIKSYVNEHDAYFSYDELVYVATHDSIPDEHNKITLVKKCYSVTKGVSLIEETANGIKHLYFETKLERDSELLKKTISTFISDTKSVL